MDLSSRFMSFILFLISLNLVFGSIIVVKNESEIDYPENLADDSSRSLLSETTIATRTVAEETLEELVVKHENLNRDETIKITLYFAASYIVMIAIIITIAYLYTRFLKR
ncbi:uncharacterized protein LOC108698906 [Xenopus laevis]|nr:uncharacterized protein LOC108698906 [Xenopus laevis]